MGGTLEPCLPDEWLRDYPKSNDGRTCPFVELAPQNSDAYFFVTLRLSEDDQPFLTPVAITFGLRHEWADTRRMWSRITRALKRPNFLAALEEWRERTKVEKRDSTEEKGELGDE